MTERINEPAFKTVIVNGRERRVRVEPEHTEQPAAAPAQPEVYAQPETPAVRTVEMIENELAENRQAMQYWEEIGATTPQSAIEFIESLEAELALAKEAAENSEHENLLIAKEAEAIEEMHRKLKNIQAAKKLLHEAQQKKNQAATPAPHVIHLGRANSDIEETQVFSEPVIASATEVIEPVAAPIKTTEQAPVAASAIEPAASAETTEASESFDDVETIRRPEAPFASKQPETITPITGQKLATHSKLHDAIALTKEKASKLPKKVQMVGGIALAGVVLAGGIMGVGRVLGGNNEATPEDTIDVAELLLPDCVADSKNDTILARHRFNATTGVNWAASSKHAIGPNKAMTSSVITVTDGKIDAVLCDNEDMPAVTVDGNTVAINLDEATILATVSDKDADGKAKVAYKKPNLDAIQPNEDGTLTADDIAEISETSKDADLIGIAQMHALNGAAESLKSNDELTNDLKNSADKKNIEQYVNDRLTELDVSEEYKVTIDGAPSDIKIATTLSETPESDKLAVTKSTTELVK